MNGNKFVTKCIHLLTYFKSFYNYVIKMSLFTDDY